MKVFAILTREQQVASSWCIEHTLAESSEIPRIVVTEKQLHGDVGIRIGDEVVAVGAMFDRLC